MIDFCNLLKKDLNELYLECSLEGPHFTLRCTDSNAAEITEVVDRVVRAYVAKEVPSVKFLALNWMMINPIETKRGFEHGAVLSIFDDEMYKNRRDKKEALAISNPPLVATEFFQFYSKLNAVLNLILPHINSEDEDIPVDIGHFNREAYKKFEIPSSFIKTFSFRFYRRIERRAFRPSESDNR